MKTRLAFAPEIVSAVEPGPWIARPVIPISEALASVIVPDIDLVAPTEDAAAVDATGSGDASGVHRPDRLPQRARAGVARVAAGRDDDRRGMEPAGRDHARRDERREQRPDDELRSAAARMLAGRTCHGLPLGRRDADSLRRGERSIACRPLRTRARAPILGAAGLQSQGQRRMLRRLVAAQQHAAPQQAGSAPMRAFRPA
ncbi:MAG: hypothetical protein IPF73_06965 [Betaproteobacteria bacterium]|nr:hypothetical protein [Betaproteobacteria bacterium]